MSKQAPSPDRKPSVGIIGFGSFGAFLAGKLDPYCEVRVYSKSRRTNKWAASLEAVAQADFLIPAIPLESYPGMLKEVQPLVGTATVLVDVCSVKQEPLAIIKSLLPKQKVVATHPLFGPESAAESLAGHTLAVCPEASDSEALHLVEAFADSVGLIVKRMSAVDHDREMATVHGLTFFIAHILKDCNIHDLKLSTPSFRRLLSLAELERQHSNDLFYTIQAGNPQTAKVRRQFINKAVKLNRTISLHESWLKRLKRSLKLRRA